MKTKTEKKDDFFDWVDVVTVSLVSVILLFTFFGRVATIDGQSMENTFHHGEKVIVSGLGYTPKRGDVVIVSRNYYNDPAVDPDDSNLQPIIKRVIATANQTVKIVDGYVYVDGEKLNEEYTKEPVSTEFNDPTMKFDVGVTVPDGCVFVLGDNRRNSHDSRYSNMGSRGNGMIDTSFIIGKVQYRVFPFNVFGGVYQ